jgi:hypothetical protein
MMRGPSKRGAELGPIGDEILFENDHVRVWSVRLAQASGRLGTSTTCPI